MKTNIFFTLFATVTFCACNGGGPIAPAYTATHNNDVDSAKNPTKLAATMPGEQIFQQRCAPCHGLGGNARNENAANLQTSRIDSLSITQTIKNGRGIMPTFNGVLNDSDLAHLAVYVKSLRK